jgi:hypothetical protein
LWLCCERLLLTYAELDVYLHKALTGVRIDSIQIYKIIIAKIKNFFLATSANAVEAHPEAMKAHPGALQAHHGAIKAHPGLV